jgi:hypothetical protein
MRSYGGGCHHFIHVGDGGGRGGPICKQEAEGTLEEEAESNIKGRRRRVIAICEGGGRGQAKECNGRDPFGIKQPHCCGAPCPGGLCDGY